MDPFEPYGFTWTTRPQWMSDAYQTGTLAQAVARATMLRGRGYTIADSGRILDARQGGWGDVQGDPSEYLPEVAPTNWLPEGAGPAGTQFEDIDKTGWEDAYDPPPTPDTFTLPVGATPNPDAPVGGSGGPASVPTQAGFSATAIVGLIAVAAALTFMSKRRT